MAHMLTTTATGDVAFAFKGDRSAIWHESGQQMPDDATVDQMSAAAGYDFRVMRNKVRFNDGERHAEVPGQHVLFHSRTKHPFGIVSDKFEVAQPAAIVDLIRRLESVVDGRIDTMGVTWHGAGFFANIVVGSPIRIAGGDSVQPNLLFATRNDGTMANRVKNCLTRAVCDNTVQAALGEGSHAMDLTITHRTRFDPAKIAAQYALYVAEWAQTAEQMRMLAQTPVSLATADQLVFDVYNARRTEAAKADPKRDIRNSAGYKTVMGLFAGAGRGANLPGVKGTAWGLFNGFTEYLEHHATAKSASHRIDSNFDGTSAAIKADAFARCLALATADSE